MITCHFRVMPTKRNSNWTVIHCAEILVTTGPYIHTMLTRSKIFVLYYSLNHAKMLYYDPLDPSISGMGQVSAL